MAPALEAAMERLVCSLRSAADGMSSFKPGSFRPAHGFHKKLDNYQRKLLRMINDGSLVVTLGEVTETDVEHDDWCGMLNGRRRCNCDPDIKPRHRH